MQPLLLAYFTPRWLSFYSMLDLFHADFTLCLLTPCWRYSILTLLHFDFTQCWLTSCLIFSMLDLLNTNADFTLCADFNPCWFFSMLNILLKKTFLLEKVFKLLIESRDTVILRINHEAQKHGNCWVATKFMFPFLVNDKYCNIAKCSRIRISTVFWLSFYIGVHLF